MIKVKGLPLVLSPALCHKFYLIFSNRHLSFVHIISVDAVFQCHSLCSLCGSSSVVVPDFSLGQGRGCWRVVDKPDIGAENLILLTILCDTLSKCPLCMILTMNGSKHLLDPL